MLIAWAKDRREMRVARWAEWRYRVPAQLYEQFVTMNPETDARQVRLVGAGLVQWVLMEQHWPRQHVMPSRAVHRLVELVREDHTAWSECVRKLKVHQWQEVPYPYPPDTGAQLRATLMHAQAREDTRTLPALFQADQVSGIADGHIYQAMIRPDDSHVCPGDLICIHYPGPPPALGSGGAWWSGGGP